MSMTAEELQAQTEANAKAEADAKAKAEAEAKANEPPKYEPKDLNKVKSQADFYARNPGDFYALVEEIQKKTGTTIIASVDDKKDDTGERLAHLEAENAKLKAGIDFGLSKDDLAILDGTPEQIEAKAKYLAERLAHAKATATSDGGTEPKPEEKGGPPIPKMTAFDSRNTDPAVLKQRALDNLTKVMSAGQGPVVK